MFFFLFFFCPGGGLMMLIHSSQWKYSRVDWELSSVRLWMCGIDQTSLISSHIYSPSSLFLSVLIFHTLLCLSLFATERSPEQEKSSELEETAGTSVAMNIEWESFYSTVPAERERPPGCKVLGGDELGVRACAWAGVKGVAVPFDLWESKRTDEGLGVTWWRE